MEFFCSGEGARGLFFGLKMGMLVFSSDASSKVSVGGWERQAHLVSTRVDRERVRRRIVLFE